jgi:hypothetical protein
MSDSSVCDSVVSSATIELSPSALGHLYEDSPNEVYITTSNGSILSGSGDNDPDEFKDPCCETPNDQSRMMEQYGGMAVSKGTTDADGKCL